MANAINPKLRLYADTYNEEGYSSVNHISNALLHQSELLSPVVTHLYGSDKNYGSRNFPLSFLTEGMKKVKSIKSIDYRLPIMGKPKKTSIVAYTKYTASERPGIGGQPFEIPFKDRLFAKNLVLVSKDKGVQVKVQTDPRREGDYWIYTVELVGSTKTAWCPPSLLAAGSKWGRLIVKVGIEASRGTEHRSYAPGMMTNQLSIVRDTYQIRGNTENKVMVIEISTSEGKKKYWCEWEMYLRNLEWKEKCESDLWYSLYNKDEFGQILNTDEDSGMPTPSGAGLLEQIPNEDSYTIMTTNKLTQIIRDAFYNASDSRQVKIRVFTGLGGLEEVDRAMKDGAKGFTLVDSKFVKGEDFNLVYGSYFKTFRHVDGHIVDFVHLPLMDEGVVAETSDAHPTTGMPLESYNMYFIDMSEKDGEANIQYVSEQGREDIEFVVPGVKVPKGYSPTVFRATDRDASSIQWMKSQGIYMKVPTNSFKVVNKLAATG